MRQLWLFQLSFQTATHAWVSRPPSAALPGSASCCRPRPAADASSKMNEISASKWYPSMQQVEQHICKAVGQKQRPASRVTEPQRNMHRGTLLTAGAKLEVTRSMALLALVRRPSAICCIGGTNGQCSQWCPQVELSIPCFFDSHEVGQQQQGPAGRTCPRMLQPSLKHMPPSISLLQSACSVEKVRPWRAQLRKTLW